MTEVNVEYYRNGLTVRISGNNFNEIAKELDKAYKWATDNTIDTSYIYPKTKAKQI